MNELRNRGEPTPEYKTLPKYKKQINQAFDELDDLAYNLFYLLLHNPEKRDEILLAVEDLSNQIPIVRRRVLDVLVEIYGGRKI